MTVWMDSDWMSPTIPHVMVIHSTKTVCQLAIWFTFVSLKILMSVWRRLTAVTRIMVFVLTHQEITLVSVILDSPGMVSAVVVSYLSPSHEIVLSMMPLML